jgi:hypothetical protein
MARKASRNLRSLKFQPSPSSRNGIEAPGTAMHDDESEAQRRFVVMIVILFVLSAALMGVLLLFDGSALNTHAAIR